ncbi:MAG: tRNA 2-selenouridine(34) synthase MnmH [Candidatus Melainabacteria bacterium HGW-Melainabacteria-1]|nr:MAG: tRNA 2-selenouridine(34) synthase MnmH [Candidatus Melainabacteria bacterium HGW-Melainabacteria-1]
MFCQLDSDAFLGAEGPILDVRAPAEYARGHLPGAICFALFDDAERAEVGTIYHRLGPSQAVLRALEIFGPKMAPMARQAGEIAGAGKVRVHCWRGGQRSGAVAWLLAQAGFEVSVLAGGYKAYRQAVLAEFARPRQLLLLGGLSGSGKTEVLQALAALGEQTLDLEGLACHRGSAFGGLGMPQQPSSEQFENALHAQLRTLNPDQWLWLEDENAHIGKVNLPLELRRQMQQAPLIALDVPRPLRLARLVRTYAGFPQAELATCVEKLCKRLGRERTRACLAELAAGQPEAMIDQVLDYYDRGYRHGLSQRQPVRSLALSHADPQQAAWQLQGLLATDSKKHSTQIPGLVPSCQAGAESDVKTHD